jgi:hypothetical protein
MRIARRSWRRSLAPVRSFTDVRSFVYVRSLAFMLLLGMSLNHGAQAQDVKAQEVYVHPESKLQFPANLGNSRRLSVQNYQDPRLGIAVTYQVAGLGRADFYVYQSGHGQVPSGINSEPMQRALFDAHSDVTEAVRRGAYVAADPLFPSSNTYELPNRIPRIYFSAYRLSRASQLNQPMVSWMFMTGMANHFVKIRISHSELQMPTGQERVAETLGAFFAANRDYW